MTTRRAHGFLLALAASLGACGGEPPPQGELATPAARPLSADGALELLAEVRGDEVPAPLAEPASVSAAPTPVRASVVFAARLIDEQFRPLPGGSLVLTRPGDQGREEVARARADANGSVWLSVALSDLPAERSMLVALAPGCAHASVAADPPRAETGGIVGLGEIILPSGGEVRGRIVDAAGTAVAGARLHLLTGDPASEVGVHVTARADGTFDLLVPPGRRWILEARDPGGRFAPVRSEPILGGAEVALEFSAVAR